MPGSLERVERFLDGRWPLGMFHLHEGGPDTPTACNTRQDCMQDPMRGGLRINYTLNGNTTFCASGPVVYKDAAEDEFLLVTAGHCFYKWQGGTNHVVYNVDVSHSGDLLGQPQRNAFYGGSSADIALIAFRAGPATAALAGHKFYRTDDDKAASINGVKCIGSFAPPITCILPGDPICKAAYPQGHGCGEVEALNYSSTFEFSGGSSKTIHDMIKGDTAYATKVRCGNSGGPVYKQDTGILYGVQSSVKLANNSNYNNACDSGAHEDFTHAGISALYWLDTNQLQDYDSGLTIAFNVCTANDYFTEC